MVDLHREGWHRRSYVTRHWYIKHRENGFIYRKGVGNSEIFGPENLRIDGLRVLWFEALGVCLELMSW